MISGRLQQIQPVSRAALSNLPITLLADVREAVQNELPSIQMDQ